MKRTAIHAIFVEFIPESLDEGVLYVSRRFNTAAHLCCCGCGSEVITPLSPAEWRVGEEKGGVSLWPSIGNWSYPCQSHYWIRANRVIWDKPMNRTQIERVRARDRVDKARYIAAINTSRSTSTRGATTDSTRTDTRRGSILTNAIQAVRRLFKQ